MMQASDAGPAPMIEINTTPLIDVMLVLLIMFLITIPIQTHAVKVDLPGPPPPEPVIVNPIRNKIVVEASGGILWNGAATDFAALRRHLDVAARMTPQPELHLQPEAEARYETVDEVLAITKRARITAMGFVGNEAYKNF